ncbi:MAG TPA: acyltransferase, partial [Nocardioides sp.]|uniref:acyltransferase family protein n=1 Tax=Nocardioides sp. TaxID=35761 RepID=UPI002E2ED761
MSTTTATTPATESTATPRLRHRDDVQGLRAIAVLTVIASHASVPYLDGGFVGVDVFFVISGFLISKLLFREAERTGRISIPSFYARRARRILPAATLVTLATVVASAIWLSAVDLLAVAKDALWAVFFAANIHFAAIGTDYFAQEEPPSPLQHYWSLSVEEQFYLVWPLLVLAVLVVARRRGLGHRGLLAVLIGTLTIGSFAYGVWFSEVSTQQAYFSTLSRGWEIGVGCALALVLPAGLRMPRLLATVLSGGAIAALVWMTLTFRDDIPYPGWYALVPTMATAAWIVAGTAVTAAAPIRLFSLAPMQYL